MKTKTTLKLRNYWIFSLCFLLTGLSENRLLAQAPSSYNFTTSTGATLDPMAGASDISPAADRDDGISTVQSIGFTFSFDGTNYTDFSASVDGFIRLGSTQATSQFTNNITSTTNIPKIFPYWDDLALGTTGTLRTVLVGTSPNQIRVIEWYTTIPRNTTGSPNSTFQLWLYETSNNIEFRYGTMLGPATSASVGIRGAVATPASFHSITVASNTTSTVTANNANTAVPASGRMYSFVPPAPAAPTAFTGTKTNITSSTVTLAGTIAPNSYPVVTASGIVVSTSPNPTVGGFGVTDSATNPVITSGSFTRNIEGLQNGTTYHYRTYATNAVGTSYGPDSTFTTNASASLPAINRIAATAITGFTASIGGSISNNGGATVTASGVVYSTSPNPAIFGTGVIDSTTTPVVVIGNYNFNLVGLLHSTKYYYRAYATNSVGTAYSVEDSFVTAPVISVLPYTENFDLPGNNGWASTSVNAGTNSWQLGTPAKTNLNGAFSGTNAWVTRLSGNYLGTEDCAVVSPQMDFSNMTTTPILRFKHEMDVDTDLGWDGGVVEISVNGGAWTRLDPLAGTAPSYNTVNSSAWYNNTQNNGALGSPKFSVNTATTYPNNVNGWITSTTPLIGAAGQSDVKVRFRFWADGGTDEGWALDDIEVFAPSAPTVQTGTKSNLTTSNVTLGGNITNNGGNAVTASGVVIGTSANPTIGGFGVIDSATNPVVATGAFTLNVNGLTAATTYYYRAYAVNPVGTSYGPDSTFTTAASAIVPTVVRIGAANVQAYTATVGGNITSDGGSPVIASGIVYSTSPNPVLFGTGVVDSTTNLLVTTGTYSINLGGLTHSTKYYYRAYATNSVGTAYSVEDSFTTAPVISVLPYGQNFDLPGNNGWESVLVGGTANNWQLGAPTKPNISAAFSTPNVWITGLSTNYVDNHNAALVSPQFDFTSLNANPILRFKHKFRTESCCDGGILEVSINGGAWTKVENTLGTGANFNTTNGTAWYNSNAQGISWGNLSTAFSTASNGWITSSIALSGAAGQSNVKFRFRFISDVSSVEEGWAIDDIEVFAPTIPTVQTGTKSNLTTSNVTLGGNITNNGGNAVTASGVVIGTSANPTIGGFGVIDSATNPVVGTGAFTLNVTGLTPATTYYYRAYAVNPVGTSYGPDSTFTTNASATAPTVLKISATNVQTEVATVGGNIVSDGGDPVIASGIVYSSTPNPSLYGTGVVDSTTTPLVVNGTFSINIAGLIHSTKYYYRAYATNNVGVSYSIEDSFTTTPIISNFPYNQNFDVPGNTGWNSAIVNGTVNNWVLGTPNKTYLSAANSAPNAWVTKLSGNYDDNHDAAVVSPQMDFTSLTADPKLSFKHKFITESGYDALVVEISINGGAWTKLDDNLGTGANYNTLASEGWFNNTSINGPITPSKFSSLLSGVGSDAIYSSQVNGWVASLTSLTGAAGQSNVKVRFRFGSDVSGNYEGWALDDIEVFEPSAPTVLTGTNANVTTSNATLAGNITNNGGNAVTASGVVISASPNPTRGAFGVVDSASTPLTATGAFTVNITGLTAATTYYYRAYAVNSIGTSYGADSVFTTPASAIIPTVQRVLATNVTTTTATFGGNITSDGGSVVTASGVVYSTTPNPTLFGTGVVDVATSPTVLSGTYTVNATGLTHSTKYYFRSYASNAVGTGYSLEDSFVTSPIITTLPYAQDFEGNVGGWSSALTSTNPSVNWVIGVVANNNWALGTPSKTYLNGARSGTKAWVTNLTGDYDLDHDASLISPQFNLTAISTDPIVRFYHKFRSESEWDGMIIEQSINGGFWTRVDSTVGIGTNYNTTNSYAWYNDNVNNVPNGGIMSPPYFSSDIGSGSVYASQNSGWVQSAFRLVGASGQSNVRFRFRFISDTYVTDEGWAIDDIEVVEVATPTTAASNVTVNPSATSATVNFTAGNGQGRMVVARLSSDIAVAPTNNTLYNASAVFGSANTTGTGNFIVYMGNGTSVNVTGLTQLTGYTFDVYEYNGKYMHISFAGAISSNTTTTPVKLVSLQATKANKDVLVSWTTASEVNNRSFNVERSIDGRTFEYVGFVKGAGNSSVTNNYRLQDANAFTTTGVSKLYYRLKQMDNDGKFEYSKVVTVENNESNAEAVITYPNPFSDKVTVELQNANAGTVKVEVLDISGRLVTTIEEVVSQGTQTIIVNGLSGLTQGIYFVRVTSSGVTQTSKLIKQ